jgi:hypothetical protein
LSARLQLLDGPPNPSLKSAADHDLSAAFRRPLRGGILG